MAESITRPSEERMQEILDCFTDSVETFLSGPEMDYLGMPKRNLKPGERISSETGEIKYSADWLNDA